MNQRSVIALQTPAGMQFGNVIHIRSDSLTFEIEMALDEQRVMSWRMELSGHRDTVLGTIKILRVRERPGGMFRCSCRILDMSAQDRARLAIWLDERVTGGTTRRYDNDVSALTQTSHVPATTMTETRNALERMNRKRGRREQQTSITRDLLGLNSEIKVGPSKQSGRAALRSALRVSMARKKVRANSLISPQQSLEDTAKVARVVDPQITRIPYTSPPRIHVRYHSEEVYLQDHRKHIRHLAMFLPLPELGGDGTRVNIHIEPPGRAPVLCRAEIKVQMPSGVGVALRLSDSQKIALEPQRIP